MGCVQGFRVCFPTLSERILLDGHVLCSGACDPVPVPVGVCSWTCGPVPDPVGVGSGACGSVPVPSGVCSGACGPVPVYCLWSSSSPFLLPKIT